jgi:endonuclease/exonuclease/phosphatase family metal-dependent hydrolase
MSFNIRNSGAGDGPNRWELRRDLWCDIVRHFNPDLLGVQEVLADQYDHLKAQFPDYTLVGVAREDGHRSGEWSLILYRTERFEEIETGNHWLSETPHIPGSRSWDSACCRLCTWVRLCDKQTNKTLVHLNVHLDHIGGIARQKSAEYLVSQFALNAGHPIILTGDFNCDETSNPYRIFKSHSLIDSYRETHPLPKQEESSYHEFGRSIVGMRIDWILHSSQLATIQAHIDRTRGPDGRCASDHDAATAVLRWVDQK